MIKNTVIALVAAASIFGAAAPAMAGAFGDGDADSRQFVSEIILAGLHDKGVNATSVEEWGDLVRAFVVQADGTETMEFFTPVQLQPVSL